MTVDELAGKLQTLKASGKGPEEILVLNEDVLLTIKSVGTFANADTGTDQNVLVAEEA